MDDLTRMKIPMFRVDPPSVKPPQYVIVHSGPYEVGDTVRVFELIDGAYCEVEGGGCVVDG